MGVFEGVFPQWAYLIGYNTVSALLWSTIFAWTALIALTDGGLHEVYPAVRTLVLFTQTLAVLEILHAIIGRRITFSRLFLPWLTPTGGTSPS